MGRIDEGPELTVYISNDEAEFQLVEEALKAERKVYHIEVSEQDRQNLIAANMVIRSITGKMFNAERVNEII